MNTRILRLLEYEKIREMLARHAASAPGREYIARMRPVRDPAIVRQRMAETSEARRAIEDRGSAPFGGLRDVRDAVTRAEKLGVLSAGELLDVAETAACSRRLRRYLLATGGEYPGLQQQGRLLGEFPQVERQVDRAISASGEVLDSASPDLERARRRVRALHDEIQRELQRIISSSTAQDSLQDQIITQRNGRFCVPVRAESRNAFKGIVHDISASGQTAFMEPLSVVELGNDLREAQRLEEEEEQRVLADLSAHVGAVAACLLESIETAGRLDAVFARALLARQQDATEPLLNTDGVVDLRQARHPLLGAGAVPIDIALGDDGFTTLLITGPNTGGKTVTLKTIGLFTLMAQSGLHVPAEQGSRLAIFDEVFADIGDEQSIEQSLSTFSGHMTNIVRIIRDASAKSLVLLDEIGAGTDPAEGAALGKAILLELQERGCRTIATTHYGELKVFGQGTEGFMNASVEFDLETLRPTYRVISGLPGSSNAFAISQRLGLPKPLITRAKALMGEAPAAMEQVLKQAEGVRRALDRERTATLRTREALETDARRLAHDLRELDEKRADALARSRQQAMEVLEKARSEANALLDELRTALRNAHGTAGTTPAPTVSSLRKKARETLAGLEESVAALPARKPSAPAPETRPALDEVKAGQAVVVRSLGHRGTALESGRGEEEVDVQVGIMRVRVPVSDLEAGRSTSGPVIPLAAPATARENMSSEIHLLGRRAEEAVQQLDTYLYDAMEEGLTRVRIVHGFGTGTLRQVVQDLLRHHPAVRQYRQGQPQEGGGGVTIAELG